MSDTKDERETGSKEERESGSQKIRAAPPPSLFLPSSSTSFDFESVSTVKRAKYTATTITSSVLPQWKQQQSPMGLQNPDSSPSPSNPQAQLTSPDSSSSPSLSPIPSSEQLQQQQFRKGKFVSPVWKPHEMLWLAKAWKAQYQGDSPGPGSGPGPGPVFEGGGGRGKTRAEKDKEVAEFLNKHGVNRDAKTAGTKWDNMLGEFRKVYEWERGNEREQVGNKSYFRLSPYERKIHRLPASFDEEVFEELSQFMGPKMRHSSSITSLHHHHHYLQTSRSLSTSNTNSSSDLINLKSSPFPPPHPFRDDNFPFASMFSERAKQMQSYLMHSPRTNPLLLGIDPHSSPNAPGIASESPRVELRRIGRMRMTWEEWVSLWAEEGEYHRGRVKVQGINLLNADELIYFDDSMVASSLEAFEDGPLKGFTVDRFVSGQHLKVFGRRKLSSSPSPPLQSSGEFQDPTEYYLGCLKAPPPTLPSLYELSWYIQEPPPEEFRLPLRKDIYRDLPHERELFFTTSSIEPLDCKSFTIDVLSSLIRSIPSITTSTSSSRDSYIALWDDCINRVISKFCPFDITFTRKQPIYTKTSSLSSSSSSSLSSSFESLQDQWPNLVGMVKNLCLWRGEETLNQVRDLQPLIDPSSTLTQKISWTYNDLPYVLGYYAIGYNVTFCALSLASPPPSSSCHDHHQKITRTDLYTLDLSNPCDRVKLLVPCWRIGILLASLVKKCDNCKSDYQREDLGEGYIIEMTPNTTTKYYPNKRRWQTTKEIYMVLDQRVVPHSERMVSYNEEELAIVYKPRGVKAKPKNMEQLMLALKQVAKALVALHDLSFMHRDLSWEKVMMVMKEGEEEWFVAGFEEAVGAPRINPTEVEATEKEKKAPEMGRGGVVHGVKVDVWGIGYLIKTSEVNKEGKVGKQVKELEGKCMEQNPELRPTAADCYHHLLQIQSSLSCAASSGI
ncbi:Mitosis inducer protein kinase cdr1 [Bienertia sinuspersici]